MVAQSKTKTQPAIITLGLMFHENLHIQKHHNQCVLSTSRPHTSLSKTPQKFLFSTISLNHSAGVLIFVSIDTEL
jgi:hypothetical protein